MTSPEGEAAARAPARSLAASLARWFAFTSFAIVFGATSLLYRGLSQRLAQESDETLLERLQIIQSMLATPGDEDELREEVESEWTAVRRGQFYARVVDASGRPVAETPGLAAALAPESWPSALPAAAIPAHGLDVGARDGRTLRLIVARSPGTRPGGPFEIQVAWDRTGDAATLRSYRRLALLVLGLSLAAVVLGGYLIAQRGLRPVEEMALMADRIRTSTLDERIPTAGLPVELGSLAHTFNRMLDRLCDSFERLGRFSADIAHELRTPVTNLRGTMEVTLSAPRTPEQYRETLSSALEESVRLGALIESLLLIARADNPSAELVLEPLDVSRELAAVREFYDPVARDGAISIASEAPEGLEAHLDRTLFRRALGNLVANALANTQSGGHIELRGALEGDRLHVAVKDDGAGIPTGDLSRVFDRFYRVDAARARSRGGLGLGLAIVRSIATLHGGTVAIESAVGRGTCVKLRFPLSGCLPDRPSSSSTPSDAQPRPGS